MKTIATYPVVIFSLLMVVAGLVGYCIGFDMVNQWVVDHKELLTVVGIPALTFAVTHTTTRASEKRAAAERKSERNLTREMKEADHRQDWIREIRECLAEYGALTGMSPDSGVSPDRLIYMRYKIEIMMNHDDADYERLLKSMDARYRTFLKGGIATNIPEVEVVNLGEIANSIEKEQWARIKRDLLYRERDEIQ